MATYKIPQNIEAEDKLIGPFTFKQFLFLIVAVISGWLTWVLFQAAAFMALLTFPIFLVSLFFGVYRREDQPVETYVLAFINYLFKPHTRVWQKERIAESVRIVAPKTKPETITRRDPKEVKGQLKRLAQVIDTRGWSTKNPIIQEPAGGHAISNEGRIVLPTQAPPEPLDVAASDDILDLTTNPVAQELSQKAQASSTAAREQAVAKMQSALKQPASQGKTTGPDTAKPSPSQGVKYDPYPAIKQHRLDPGSSAVTEPHAGSTQQISQLAENEELTVSQIAAQAGRYHKQQVAAGEEVELR